jgi:hypothetical protein
MENYALHWLDGPLDHEPRQSTGNVIDWSNRFTDLPFQEFDEGRYFAVCTDWLNRLSVLRYGYPPDLFFPSEPALPTEQDVERFTRRLITLQRNDTAPTMKPGSWAIPWDTAMPSDARVEFAYFPTYMAVAWLCLIRQNHPEIAARLDDFDKTLGRGLRFASYRKLQGHGHEADRQCLDAIEILSLGKVFSYIRDDRSRSPAFGRMLNEVESKISDKMPRSTDWGRTDPARRERALALLRGADTDDARVCNPVRARWEYWYWRFLSGRVAAAAASAAKALLVPGLLK